MVVVVYVSLIIADRIFGPFLLKSYCCVACELCYVHLCARVRNCMTEYIFSENSKAITNGSARSRTYNKKQSEPPTYASHVTQRWGHNRKDPNFDNFVQFLKYRFHSFHFVTLKIQALLPFETSEAVY
jgi:hypothetical protein